MTPLVLYHGSQRWEGSPRVVPHKKGHAEAGAGIYMTTSFETAKSYAKGGGSVIRFELDPDIKWLEDTKLQSMEMIAFVRSTSGMKKRKEIIADIERAAARYPVSGSPIPAATLVNLMVNHEAIAGIPGQKLAAFLVYHGIDASHDRRGREDWVVLFNPAKIRTWRTVKTSDVSAGDYDLPRIVRANPSDTANIRAMKLWIKKHRLPFSSAVEIDSRVRSGERTSDAVTDILARRFSEKVRESLTPEQIRLITPERRPLLSPLQQRLSGMKRGWSSEWAEATGRSGNLLEQTMEEFGFQTTGPKWLRIADDPRYRPQKKAVWKLAREHRFWTSSRENPRSGSIVDSWWARR